MSVIIRGTWNQFHVILGLKIKWLQKKNVIWEVVRQNLPRKEFHLDMLRNMGIKYLVLLHITGNTMR